MPDDYRPSSDFPGDDFQDITTRLRTTRGSQYALNVMAEAADIIDALRAADRVTVAPDLEAREAMARALGEFVTHAPVRSLDGPNGAYWLREVDAMLAAVPGVLGVPADLIRAEAEWKALGRATQALAEYRDGRRSPATIQHATEALRVVAALHAEAAAEVHRKAAGP